MNSFKDLKLSYKLACIYVVTAIVLLMIGYGSYSNMEMMDARLDRITEVRLASNNLLLQADRDMHQALIALRTMVFVRPGTKEFDEMEKFYQDNIRQAGERWEKYMALPKTEQESHVIKDYHGYHTDWIDASSKVMKLIKADAVNKEDVINIILTDHQSAFQNSRSILDNLTDISDDLTKAEAQLNNDEYATAITYLLISILGGIILSIVISWRIGVMIYKPILCLKEASERNRNEFKAIPVESIDEVGSLTNSFNL
ncbi:MAG TPA: MCP four helix bundle domain-containing protein, partial [Patescibacteria group bacterium]|nr:MCP four helix bundle domain-containing protein [Patescibacteria group bacterium]